MAPRNPSVPPPPPPPPPPQALPSTRSATHTANPSVPPPPPPPPTPPTPPSTRSATHTADAVAAADTSSPRRRPRGHDPVAPANLDSKHRSAVDELETHADMVSDISTDVSPPRAAAITPLPDRASPGGHPPAKPPLRADFDALGTANNTSIGVIGGVAPTPPTRGSVTEETDDGGSFISTDDETDDPYTATDDNDSDSYADSEDERSGSETYVTDFGGPVVRDDDWEGVRVSRADISLTYDSMDDECYADILAELVSDSRLLPVKDCISGEHDVFRDYHKPNDWGVAADLYFDELDALEANGDSDDDFEDAADDVVQNLEASRYAHVHEYANAQPGRTVHRANTPPPARRYSRDMDDVNFAMGMDDGLEFDLEDELARQGIGASTQFTDVHDVDSFGDLGGIDVSGTETLEASSKHALPSPPAEGATRSRSPFAHRLQSKPSGRGSSSFKVPDPKSMEMVLSVSTPADEGTGDDNDGDTYDGDAPRKMQGPRQSSVSRLSHTSSPAPSLQDSNAMSDLSSGPNSKLSAQPSWSSFMRIRPRSSSLSAGAGPSGGAGDISTDDDERQFEAFARCGRCASLRDRLEDATREIVSIQVMTAASAAHEVVIGDGLSSTDVALRIEARFLRSTLDRVTRMLLERACRLRDDVDAASAAGVAASSEIGATV